MRDAPKMAFAHMGIFVFDTAKMADFYSRVLGFCITDRAQINGVEIVFLSRNPGEHHQIVLVPGRVPQQSSTVNQISFRVVSLSELQRLYRKLTTEGISSLNPTNHGGSWSLYFPDLEGNRIELFAQTPWYIPPVSIPLDLEKPEEEIYQLTEQLVMSTPGHMMRTEWYERTRRRMETEGTLEVRV